MIIDSKSLITRTPKLCTRNYFPFLGVGWEKKKSTYTHTILLFRRRSESHITVTLESTRDDGRLNSSRRNNRIIEAYGTTVSHIVAVAIRVHRG